MSTVYSPGDLRGRTVYASDGEKLGKIDDVLEDDRGVAQYLEVRSGWFGAKRHVVPVYELSGSGEDLSVPYTKAQLEGAPTFDESEDIDYERERTLGGHYGHTVREWDETRDRWLAGEDLSRGPTPQTRHPAGYAEGRDVAERDSAWGETGGVDDVADTTQGPTPTTRQTMRATEEDVAAAGQPASDRATRGDVGGNQDMGVRPATEVTDRGVRRDADYGTSASDPATGTASGLERPGVGSPDTERRVRLRRWAKEDTRSGR
jgi:sporulation protein YlmC with PRC-barrel domain